MATQSETVVPRVSFSLLKKTRVGQSEAAEVRVQPVYLVTPGGAHLLPVTSLFEQCSQKKRHSFSRTVSRYEHNVILKMIPRQLGGARSLVLIKTCSQGVYIIYCRWISRKRFTASLFTQIRYYCLGIGRTNEVTQ